MITLSNKVYVDVLAEFSKDGLLIPKEKTLKEKVTATAKLAGHTGTCEQGVTMYYKQQIRQLMV